MEAANEAPCALIETVRNVAHRVPVDTPRIIAHEIGHSGGPPNDPGDEHDELGIMERGT